MSKLFVTATQMGGMLVLARILAPASFGLFALAIVIVGVLQEIADSGFSNALVRDDAIGVEVLSAIYWLNAGLGILLAASLGISAPLIARFFERPEIEATLRWCGLVFVLSPVGNMYSWLLRRDLDFRALSIIECTAALVWIATTIALARAGFESGALVAGFLARAAIRTSLFWAIGRARYPSVSRSPSLKKLRSQAELLRFAGYQLLERATYYAGNNVDNLVVGKALGLEALGYYSIAYNLMISLVRFVVPVATSVAYPVAARLRHDAVALRGYYTALASYYAAVVVPCLTCAVWLAPMILSTLYGPRWSPSVRVFQALCCVGLFYGFRAIGASMLQVIGRADLSFFSNLAAVACLALASIAGARLGGIQGVALGGALVSVLVIFPIDCYWRWRFFGIHPARSVWAVLEFVGLAAGALILGHATASILPIHDKSIFLAAASALGILAYGGLLLLIKPPIARRLLSLAGINSRQIQAQ